MKLIFASSLLVSIALTNPTRLTAQDANVPAAEKAEPAPIGVLIGLDRLYDAQKPSTEMPITLEHKKFAAYQVQWEENKKTGQEKAAHYDTKPEDSPYVTVWIEWSTAGAKIRLLRDIIVPRKDGFWRFGVNHSNTKSAGDDNDQEFFWMARIGTEPQLTRAEELESFSQASTRRLTYIDPNYFSYRELGQSWGGTYGESEHASVRNLDEFAKAAPKESDYGWEHPGMPLAALFGHGSQPEFDKITQRGVPKDSEQEQPNQPATDSEEDPCAGSGYRTSETNWNIISRKGSLDCNTGAAEHWSRDLRTPSRLASTHQPASVVHSRVQSRSGAVGLGREVISQRAACFLLSASRLDRCARPKPHLSCPIARYID